MPLRAPPNWGPPIPPSTSEPHRIDLEGDFNDYSLPGFGRAAAPAPQPRSRTHLASSPSNRRFAPHAAASSSSDISSDDDDDHRRGFATRESTGNHAALAASSTIGVANNRRKAQRLPERALERLDRWAAGAAAAANSSKHAGDDSCEPTYIVERPTRAVASSPLRQPPTRRRRSPSPPPAPRRGDSSNETLVDAPIMTTNAGGYRKMTNEKEGHDLLLPSGVNMGRTAQPPLALPDDITGVTSALGSPSKTRYGIRHAPLHPRNALVGQLPARREQLNELKAFVLSIEDELETTKDRLEGVEQKEQELRGNFREFEREVREERKGVRQQQTMRSAGGSGDSEHWQANIAEMARHVQALSLDLKAYKDAVADLQQPVMQAKRSAPPMSSQTEEEYRLLQRQVARIEDELSRLRSVVDGSKATTASQTLPTSAEAAPTKPPARRTSPFAAQRPPPARVSDAEEEDGDETPKASAMAAQAKDQQQRRERASSPTPAAPRRREPTAQSVRIAGEEEDDMTIAETRVDRTVRGLQSTHDQREPQARHHDAPPLNLTHDAETCTVCSTRAKSDQRRASRKQRIAASVRRQESGAVEEELLLSFLGGTNAAGADDSLASAAAEDAGRASHLSASQLALLNRLIKQHLDEFIHQRLLYSELADEVKKMHPDSMDKRKRRILVDHVVEAVEELEGKARRIEALRRLLPRGEGERKNGAKLEKAGKQQREPQPQGKRPALSSAKYVNSLPTRGGAPTLRGVLASVSE